MTEPKAALERRDAPVAIVTGGATGIGRATARALAARGVTVVIGYLTSVRAAEELVTELAAHQAPCLAVRADVAAETDASRLVDHAVERFGRLDYLVNNAGATIARARVDELPPEVWNRALAVNLTSAYLMCRASIPNMRRRPRSAIVNVTSSSAFTGGSGGAVHYAAAKAGLVGFTRGLAAELAGVGIRVNAVAPAAIDTSYHDKWPSNSPPSSWITGVPLGRLGSPEEVADTITFLLCDTAAFITGQTIHVNGGSHMY